jgi:hypothetical protein
VIINDIFEQTGLGFAARKTMRIIHTGHNYKSRKVVTLISYLLSNSQHVSTRCGCHHDAVFQTHVVKKLIQTFAVSTVDSRFGSLQSNLLLGLGKTSVELSFTGMTININILMTRTAGPIERRLTENHSRV